MENLISRNTPRIKDNFVIKYIESDNGFDCYEIYAEDKKVVLAGNNNSALAMAYYRYLADFCNVLITNADFDISNIASTPLPEEKICHTVKQKIRARMSYEFFSLEGNFRGFDRWEKEIDFMAMTGINVALQPIGFDGVLYRTLCEIGMKEEFCAEFSSGPAFIMRQLTGNIAATHSVNSKDYLERKIVLGRKITEREKELGIEPVLPAIMPSVPFSLRKKDTHMDIFKAPMWYNFPPIFYIKPENYYFTYYNKKFHEIQKELIGETHSYFFEPLFDVKKSGYDSYLEKLGVALSDFLGEQDEKAVCYTHTGSITSAFLSKNSGERYIFIDDENVRNTSDFLNGQKYIVNIKGNAYGRTGIYGNVDRVLENPFAQAENAIGTSLEIDSFDINPLYCAATLKVMTESEKINVDEFIKDYAYRRYRTHAYDGYVKELKDLCNQDECSGSIICARPCTDIKHTAPFDSVERKIDYRKLYNLAKEILDSDERKTSELRKDVQSIVRQFLSEFAYPVYIKATEFFKNKNVGAFEQASNLFLEICEDTDRLLRTTEDANFCTKYMQSQELGDNKEEKEAIQINYLLLHTVWGPLDHSMLYDTVWAEWAGLIKDYYAGRWYMYFRSLAAYFKNPKKLKDNSKKQPLDRNEYKGSYQAKRLALFENNFLENYIPRKDGIEEEDTLVVAKEILEKYSEVIDAF